MGKRKTRWVLAVLMLSLLNLTACVAADSEAGEEEVQAVSSEENTEDAPEVSAPEDESPTPEPSADADYVGRVSAPAFPAGLDWVNVPGPLPLHELRGKVVLLDFWTYGCINCIHMLPVLERLEEEYAEELVIISVHSAKFDNEGETDNIRQIVQRYGITHPVINDSDFQVWRAYQVQAWPTFAVIDPRGNLWAREAGEIPYEAFDRVIGGMVAYFDGLGEINREPITVTPESESAPSTALLFPGKVLADEAGSRLFISDSGHNRIVIADLNTFEVLDIIGTGQQGFADGVYDAALFNSPQGLALDGETLYVADTNNHAIRAVDLQTQDVITLAGTGQQGATWITFGEVITEPLEADLRSPWDVTLGDDETLYVAMAGTHQIWAYSLAEDTLQIAVGNGLEALKNDTLATSELAQPSGLYYEDGLLYFADSESSSVRVADFNRDEVRTISGPSQNSLFEFGDVDGVVGEGLLQHPLHVTAGPDGTLYIADTYNSKIKQVSGDPLNTQTVFGLGGSGGFRDGGASVAAFDEPGGLDYVDGRLIVADTNNHAVRVIDLDTGLVSTVQFPNPEALRLSDDVMVVGSNTEVAADVVLPAQQVAVGEGEVILQIALPEGFKINDLIESTGTLASQDGLVDLGDGGGIVIDDSREVRIPTVFSEGDDMLRADLTLYYCRTGEEALCFVDMLLVEVPVTVSAEGESTLMISHEIVPPPGV